MGEYLDMFFYAKKKRSALNMSYGKFMDTIGSAILDNKPDLVIYSINGLALEKYYLENPDDISLKNMLHTNIPINRDRYYVLDVCYEYVVKNDRVDIINYIIATSPENPMELLHICLHAIGQNKIFILKLLVDINYNFNIKLMDHIIGRFYKVHKKIHKWTPLTYACAVSSLDTIEYLVNSGANINFEDYLAFCYSCMAGLLPVVNYFMQFEINEEYLVRGAVGACRYNYSEISERIIMRGINIQAYADTICDYIAHSGTPDMIQYFINHGLSLDSGKPLKLACRYNNMKLVSFYLKYGLQINNKLLDNVLRNINLPMIELFLDHNIDFSQWKYPTNSHDKIICELEQHGLNMTAYINFLFDESKE